MSNTLLSKVIRLAHQNPELRPHLLPLLKSASGRYFQYLNSLNGLRDSVVEGHRSSFGALSDIIDILNFLLTKEGDQLKKDGRHQMVMAALSQSRKMLLDMNALRGDLEKLDDGISEILGYRQL